MTPAQLRDLYERKSAAINRRPRFASGMGHASVRFVDEIACEVAHNDREDHRCRVDLPAEDGGTGSAPHPGQLMRASLGACLAMGYKIWGARLGIPVDDVTVEVTCEYDTRGQLGLDSSVAIGWQRIGFDVTVTSSAPEADVRRLVAQADRLSPMLANIAREVEKVHRLTILRSRRAAGAEGR
jgi:uncharacterized OsmC-like protein